MRNHTLLLTAVLILSTIGCGGDEIGVPCSESSDCADGLECRDVWLGYLTCSAECAAPGAGSSSCGDGAACLEVGGAASCLARCDAAGECAFGGPGYPFVGSDECVCLPWADRL